MGWRKDKQTRPFFVGYDQDGNVQYVDGDYIGGDVSSITQSEMANRYNWNAMLQQQKFNAQQQELANAFNERMYDKNNAYNSPSAQMARFAAAGLNPYMMMASGQTNTAQATTSSSPASSGMASASTGSTSNAASMIQAESAQKQTALQAVSSITSQIADTVDKLGLTPRSAAEIQLLSSQAENQKSSSSLSISQRGLNDYNLGFLQQTDKPRQQAIHTLNKLQSTQSDLASEQANLTRAQTIAQELTNLKLPAQLSANIAESISRTHLNEGQLQLLGYKMITEQKSWSQIEASVAKDMQDIVESAARVEGIKINNKILNITSNYTNERIKAELSQIYQNTDYLQACKFLKDAETTNARTPQNTANYLQRKIDNASSVKEATAYRIALDMWIMQASQDEFVDRKSKIIGNIVPFAK